METSMTNCQLIKNQLDLLMEERDSVEEQLETTTNPAERSNLIFELRSLNHEIATKLSQYNACLHPPPPKPDLVAKTFQIKPNRAAGTLEVACVIENDGDGPARGPFEVVLGASYTDQSGTKITRQLNIHVPNGVTIEGHGTQYVTEPIKDIPLLYRDDNPAFVYVLEMIVDATNQVTETSESNNHLGTTYWTVHSSSS
jgi:hypothetical protein